MGSNYLVQMLFEEYTKVIYPTTLQGCCKQGGWRSFSPPVFGQKVNPISTRGADYTHHITTVPPPQLDF